MQLFLATAALFACLTVAQDLSAINNLPPCGKTCINNMLALAPSLGCANNNITCLCTNTNFGFGVRDCSGESCPSGTDTGAIISVGNSFCSEALAAGTSGKQTATAVSGVSTVASGTATVASGSSTVFTRSTSVSAAAAETTGISGSNSTSGNNSTSSGNSTGKVITTINSAGSTFLSTSNPTKTSSSSSGSSSGSGSSGSGSSGSGSSGSGSSTSPSSSSTSKSSAATYLPIAGAGFLGFAGMAACALL